MNTFLVNVPAAATGWVAVMSAKSGFGGAFADEDAEEAAGGVATGEIAALIPACVAATLNPLGNFVASMGPAKRAAFEADEAPAAAAPADAERRRLALANMTVLLRCTCRGFGLSVSRLPRLAFMT